MALSPEERTWAAVAHLAPLVGYFLLIGQVLLPLAILFLGPKTPFVQAHAKESLNGQISYTLYGLGLFLLALTVVGLVVVYPLALATAKAWLRSWLRERWAKSPSSAMRASIRGAKRRAGLFPSIPTQTSFQERLSGQHFWKASLAARRAARLGKGFWRARA